MARLCAHVALWQRTGFRAAMEELSILERIRGRVPSHQDRREEGKQGDKSKQVRWSDGRKLRTFPYDGFYFLSKERSKFTF